MPYDRYWELHVLHSSGLPNVAGGPIGAWANRKAQKHGGLVHWMARQLPNGIVVPTLMPIPAQLPVRAVVSAVVMPHIAAQIPSPPSPELVAWISTTKMANPATGQQVDVRGKLRVYVHGDGEGNIYCVPPVDPITRQPIGMIESAPAFQLYHWLAANGLRPPDNQQYVERRTNGLTMVSLFSCKAGEGLNASAAFDEETHTSRPAPGSAVERLQAMFRMSGYHGVAITGPAEDIAHLGGPNATAVHAVGPLPVGWSARPVEVGGIRTVEFLVPASWRLDKESDGRGRIHIPAAHRLFRMPSPSGMVWVLEEPPAPPAPGYQQPYGGFGFPPAPPGQYGYAPYFGGAPPPPPPRQHIISGSWAVNLAGGYLVAPLGWDLYPENAGGGRLRSRVRTNIFPGPAGEFAGTPYAGSPFQTKALS